MVPIKLPKEQKERIVRALIAFYAEERSEELGSVSAEQLVDFMLREIAPYAYNKAIADARQAVLQSAASLEDELYALERKV
ncbi:DUF2164 domain-containing protein [Paenibacillus humicola]|uniref:DUF2164 domain-containing protein n=1 Tax=Paenibacillus humicola TaxID=3110540 RepID=UPI00237BC066|nr:DUF2164 domain-containing protein [Paenibacillus humicola]